MVENIEEEHLDNPVNTQSENTSDDILSITNPENIHQKQEIETMEVHHPHHPSHKKKWNEYLLEFFMLFLAVFLGFVAENIREHSIENERAKQYIRSFYNDLLKDTAQYSMLISEFQIKVDGLQDRKQCFQLLQQPSGSECLLNLFKISAGFKDLITSDQTLQQLKNSGNFRLLNHEDTDSIMLYDKMIRSYIKPETTGFQETQYNIRNTMYALLNYGSTIQQNGNTQVPFSVFKNTDLLNRYFNLLDHYFSDCQMFLGKLIVLNQKAISLIKYFKNKYNLSSSE